MNIPKHVAYEIEHKLINEIRLTSKKDRSGDHTALSISGDRVKFNLDWQVAWQVPGKPPTRAYAIRLLQ